MRWLVAALVALAFSGCLDDGTTDDVVVEEPPVAAEVQRFEGVLDMTVTQVNTPVNRGSYMTPNCVRFEEDDLHRIESAVLTATWDASVPTHEELELRVFGKDDVHVAQGTSPLVLEVEDVLPDGFFESVLVMVQAPSPVGVTAAQDVSVAIEMDYEGGQLQPRDSVCSFS